MRGIGERLTYANVMATIAVFLALGAGAYAAFHLPKNSVKSKHIVNGQVKSKDVKDDGLTGTDINESSLAQVPAANLAATATEATHAASADSATNASRVNGMTANGINYAAAQSSSTTLVDFGSIGSLTFSANCHDEGADTRMQVRVRSSRAGLDAAWTTSDPPSTSVITGSALNESAGSNVSLEDGFGTGPVVVTQQVVLTTHVPGNILLSSENATVTLLYGTAHVASGTVCTVNASGIAG